VVRERNVGCSGIIFVENPNAGDAQAERQRDHGMAGLMVGNTAQPVVGHASSSFRFNAHSDPHWT
jgi:hypothetical protein